uniref:Uncharacterized protein n=1 Tax=Parascaris equorum TaxID=6256 RepID=A0A914R7Q6_PAREQ
LTVCSLLSVAFTTPAGIPKKFAPPDEFVEKYSRSLLQAIAEWARSQKLSVRFRKMATDLGITKAPNYCYICRLIKPDRAHHCRNGDYSRAIPTILVTSGAINALVR